MTEPTDRELIADGEPTALTLKKLQRIADAVDSAEVTDLNTTDERIVQWGPESDYQYNAESRKAAWEVLWPNRRALISLARRAVEMEAGEAPRKPQTCTRTYLHPTGTPCNGWPREDCPKSADAGERSEGA